MKFFTLLHIAENEKSMHNNRAKTFTKQIQVYVNCIKVLHASLQHKNLTLAVLTNNKTLLTSIFAGYSIEIVEFDFKMNIPTGTDFYSAHYKIEVFRFLSELQEDYVALVDSDVICINKMPLAFSNCIEKGIPLYYDISKQVHPVFGQDTILKDKRMVDSNATIALWAGGEFIAGPPSFFKKLYAQIEGFSERYFTDIKKFHHQGDEFLTSVAIEDGILNKRYVIFDAGNLDIIGRYWSYPTEHEQPAFATFLNCFLLHLPSDKSLISSLDIKTLDFSKIIQILKAKNARAVFINSIKVRVRKLGFFKPKH